MKPDELEKNIDSSTHNLAGERKLAHSLILLASRRWGSTLEAVLVKLYRLPIKLWNWTVNYAGFGATFIKLIPVVIEVLIISYPVLTYTYILGWSQTLTPAWQLLTLILWFVQFPTIFIVTAWTEYKRRS